VINFAAAIYACHVDDIDLSNYPVLLNWCANKAATCWVNVRCKSSMIGRNLAKISIGLLMGTNLSIHAGWLSTKLNVIADNVPRLEDADGNYDYSQLIVDHPSLINCCQFQPSPILLGMILDVLLNNASPDPLMIKKAETSGSRLIHFLGFVRLYRKFETYLTNNKEVTDEIMTRLKLGWCSMFLFVVHQNSH